MLKGYDPWKKYFNNLQNEQNDERSSEEGSHFLAKVFQDEAANVQSSKITKRIIQIRSKMQDKEPEQESPARYGGCLRGEDVSHAIKDYRGEYPFHIELGFGNAVSSKRATGARSIGLCTERQLVHQSIDKQIVNTALLDSLKAITQHFPDISHGWTIYRKAFCATANQVKPYETQTDRCLSDKHGQSVCCLMKLSLHAEIQS